MQKEKTPSQKVLYEMLMDLSKKYKHLEEKIEKMESAAQRTAVSSSKKIDLHQWLETNVHPSMTYETLVASITFEEYDVEKLLHSSFYEVLNDVFIRAIYSWKEDCPIYAFVRRPNEFYIYTNDFCWVVWTNERFVQFLNKMHIELFKRFHNWKKSKVKEIHESDQFAYICDKTLVKLMSVEFQKPTVVEKIKNQMYCHLRKDIRSSSS